VVNHVLNELDIVCLPDDLPEFIQVDLSGLTVGHSIHVRDLSLPKGVEPALHKNENPVVATIVIPKLVTEDEEVAPAVSAADVPTTEQAAPAKEGEAAAGAAAKGGAGAEKGAEKAGDKAAEKPGDKGGEKKEKK
jgi:large subunit ribosomal protein L25